MVFWIAILSGVLFAWLAVRLGFYATWVLLFNVLLSIYVAIFLAPLVVDFAPTSGKAASYGMALSMIVLAGGCFAILHGLSYVFLTGQFNIPFPRVFDIVVSGVLGFLAGFLILSFAAIVLTATPLARQEIVSSIGFNSKSLGPNMACLARCCDLIHAVAGSEGDANTTGAAIDRLIAASKELELKRSEQKSDPNKPPEAPGKSPPRQPAGRRKIPDQTGDAP